MLIYSSVGFVKLLSSDKYRKIDMKIRNKIEKLTLANIFYYIVILWAVSLHFYFDLSIFRFLYNNLIKRIRIISFINYIDFKKDIATKVIEEEIGWKDYGGKHHESIYTRFYQSYILPKKFNIDKRKAHLSCQIISHIISFLSNRSYIYINVNGARKVYIVFTFFSFRSCREY